MRVPSGYRPALGLGGDEDVVEVVGHEAVQGYRPTAMLREARAQWYLVSIVQACEVAICCWAFVPRRAAWCYRGAARRERCRHRESGLVFKSCVCARAVFSDCGPTRNEYCAGQRTDTIARPRKLGSKPG